MATIHPLPRKERAGPMPQPGTTVPASGQPGDSGELWAALMVLAQDGNQEAYHALLLGITPYLRAVARRYLGPGEDADDAVQEILLTVHGIRHTYERGRPFKPWLSTIATRRCIDLLRRRSRRLEHEAPSAEEFDPPEDPALSPDESTARLREAHAVHKAVADLSPKLQEAVRLVHLGELSLNEASVVSRQSVGSLKVACHRALKALKRTLGRNRLPHE